MNKPFNIRLVKLKETRVIFIIILAITLFLRMINIVSEQIWEDEGTSMAIASAPLNEFWRHVINDVHPPLYYLILKGWFFLFGTSIFSGRMLSVIFSSLTLPILYLIGKEAKNEKVGLIISFFYSLSPFSIFYANEIRSYSFILLLFTIGIYVSIKCLKTVNITKYYFLLSVIGVLLIYTHYMGFVYFGTLCLGLFILKRGEKGLLKNMALTILILLVSYLPWIPYALNDSLGGAHGYAGGPLNLISLFYWAFNFFLGPVPSNINNPYIFNLILMTFLINLPLMVLSVITVIGFVFSIINKEHVDEKNSINFIIISIGLLFGISIVLGFIIENSFTAKNLIGGISLIYVIYSIGLYNILFEGNFIFKKSNIRFFKILNPEKLKKISYIFIIAFLICGIGIYPIFRASYLQKPDWDGCFKRLKKDFKKSDIIILGYDGGGYSDVMEYYSDLNDFDLEDNFYELSYSDDDIEEFLDEISEKNITRIWIINFWQNLRDPDDKTEDMLIDEYDLEEIEDYYYRLDITLILYERP